MKAHRGRGVRSGTASFRRSGSLEVGEGPIPADELAFRLGSWLCHDLAGPLGVLVGSLDLLEMPDAEVQVEARAMLTEAVDDMMDRLAFNRIAFGLAGRGLASRERPEPAEKDEPGCGQALPHARWEEGGRRRPSLVTHGAQSHKMQEGVVHLEDNPNVGPLEGNQPAMDTRSGPGGMDLREATPAGQILSSGKILRILRGRFEPRHHIVWRAPQDLPRHEVRRLFLSVLAMAARLPNGGSIEVVLETNEQGTVWQFETGDPGLSARSNATSALCEALLDGLE